jgi:UV DNA damage endonuclease
MNRPLRLGFPVKVLGRPGLKGNDTRRWQKGPHLKCSLEYVDQILDYLAKVGIDMYRLSSDLAPYATHPDMPQFHNMVAESDAELAAFGRKARELDFRLSFHPSQYVLLNSPDPELTRKSIWDLSSQAEMLDRMGLDDHAVMVTHVGGVYDDREASRARWIAGWEQCPEHVRRRLVLENDDIRFSAADQGADQGDRAHQDGAAAADLDRAQRLHQSVRIRDLHAHGGGAGVRRHDGRQVQGRVDHQAAPRPAAFCT